MGFACLELPVRPRSPARSAAPPGVRIANLAPRTPRALGAPRLIEAGAARLGSGRVPIAARLARLVEVLDGLFARLRPQELAIEGVFAGRSVQSALRIGEARGVVLALAHGGGISVHEYAPARIKRSVAGSGRASKDAVAFLVQRRLGLERLDGPRDVSDAVAVALCHVESMTGVRRAPS